MFNQMQMNMLFNKTNSGLKTNTYNNNPISFGNGSELANLTVFMCQELDKAQEDMGIKVTADKKNLKETVDTNISLPEAKSIIAQRVANFKNATESIIRTDKLTGLNNRREFDKRLNEEFSRAKRYDSPLCVAIFDIDHFKKINDTYGHPAGDTILTEMGKIIGHNVRNTDIACRYGGEEFAVILPGINQEEAYKLINRLRKTVSEQKFNEQDDHYINATVSGGVAEISEEDKTPVNLTERADKALYKAKNSGRNQIIGA